MELGQRLKSKRLEKNMTLEDLGKKANVSRATIQRYESGVITNIPSDKIELLASALGVSPAYLMGWDDSLEKTDFINSPQKSEDEKDIARTMSRLKEQLMNEQGLMFDGELLDEETIKLVLEEVERQERLIKTINKKYIPKKYRK